MDMKRDGVRAAAQTASAARGLPMCHDTGPILVAVSGQADGWDALEWAAAEAAARQSALRIVHAINWPCQVLDPFGGVSLNWQDTRAPEWAELVLAEAARRARVIAPDLPISTHMQVGKTATAVLREGQTDALIVIGRGRTPRWLSPFSQSASRTVARHASGPVAVIGPLNETSHGSSGGRVVVGLDGTEKSTAAIDFAFRAARRRGVGVTVLHAWTPRRGGGLDDAAAVSAQHRLMDDAVRTYRVAFPDVETRQQLVVGAAGPALVTESTGAALLVLGGRARGRLHLPIAGSLARMAERKARSPVAIIKAPTVTPKRAEVSTWPSP